MKKLDFSVTTLIKSVQERPCLWDRRLESYKDRGERKSAWQEIYSILYENYDELDVYEQRRLGELVLAKWTNTRDAFVKAVKKKGAKKKCYMFFNNLSFLLDVLPGLDKTEDNPDQSYVKEDFDTIEEDNSQTEEPSRIDHEVFIYENSEEDSTLIQPTTSKRRKVKKHKEESRDESPKSSYLEYNTSDSMIEDRVMNEDEAFFASLLPSVVKYSEEERLEFRIEVLDVMKRINCKRNKLLYYK